MCVFVSRLVNVFVFVWYAVLGVLACLPVDGFQIDENSTDLRTSRFECEALSAKQTASIVERALRCHLWRASFMHV